MSSADWDLVDHVYGTLYGQCIGDAIGLLTEFFNKETCQEAYGDKDHLEYADKLDDMHRVRWKVGDWTDDSDQMICIMDSLVENNGKLDALDVALRILHWAQRGYKELGDHAGMGIGSTTSNVLKHQLYKTEPHRAAEDIWRKTGCVVAPNGGVMRTSVLGIHHYQHIDQVIENAVAACKVTHADPRCAASCVAVVTAIAFMLQRSDKHVLPSGEYNIKAIITDSYKLAKTHLQGKHYRKYKTELKKFMFVEKLNDMKLDAKDAIGYTYKTMGSGFWAIKQTDFRQAMEALIMQGGDADTNGAVAGAMLGCKLGSNRLPDTWRNKLLHKAWLDAKILRFLELQGMARANTSETGESNTVAPPASPDTVAPPAGSPERKEGCKEEEAGPDPEAARLS